MKLFIKIKAVITIVLAASFSYAAAQDSLPQQQKDTTKIIQLVHAGQMIGIERPKDTTNITKFVDSVEFQQGNTTFTCDSAYLNNNTNAIDAFGNIHINQSDSINTYGDILHYEGTTKKATLNKNVKLTDGNMVLTTPQLDYDMAQHIGIYSNGGRLVNDSTVLTSQTGYYYADTKNAYFKKNVVLTDPQYTLHTDTLLYNTTSQVATFVAPTIINTGKSTTTTSSGYYDTKNGIAHFAERPTIQDSTNNITADNFSYNKASGISVAEGNVIWTDTSRNISETSDYAEYNENTKTLVATQHPLLIYKMKNDTMLMSADTLYSAIAPPPPAPADSSAGDSLLMADSAVANIAADTLPVIKKTPKVPQANKELPQKISNISATAIDSSGTKDSVNRRYFLAYHHVKIFSDSLQGVADSMYYSFTDSTFRFYKDPVLWAGGNQLTGDTIFLLTKNQQADQLILSNNALIVNKNAPNFYNQVKGNIIHGYFKNNQLDWMHVNGNAEGIYYPTDDNDAYIGVSHITGSVIDIYFKDQKLLRVVSRQDAKMTIDPILQAKPDELRLSNFKWEESRRPKNEADLKK